jgi:hypothetical protein
MRVTSQSWDEPAGDFAVSGDGSFVLLRDQGPLRLQRRDFGAVALGEAERKTAGPSGVGPRSPPPRERVSAGMGNGALAIGPKLPRPSSTPPSRHLPPCSDT